MKKSDASFEAIAKWVEINGYMQVGGATQVALLENFNISRNTLNLWLKDEDFRTLIKNAQDVYSAGLLVKLENALRATALGEATSEDVKETEECDAKGNPVVVQRITTTKRLPPNVAALIFMLCNIAPDKWQQKQIKAVTTEGDDVDFSIRIKRSDGTEQRLK